MEIRLRRRNRHGSYNAMLGFMLPVILGFAALSVDMSWVRLAESQVQDAADASAHGALIELRQTGSIVAATEVAEELLSRNSVADGTADLYNIEFGGWDRGDADFDVTAGNPNAVRIAVDRAGDNAIDLHFARIWKRHQASVEASATVASRSLHVVLVMDLTISFKDRDFYNARTAALTFLEVMSAQHGSDDQIGLATFNYAYGVEFTPMFHLGDSVATDNARSSWAAMETVWRASVNGNTNSAERNDPCSFQESNRRSHMPRAYKSQHRVNGRWRTNESEHATDHHVGLLMAQQMLNEVRDPFAYRAVIMLTDGAPYVVRSSGDDLRQQCAYVEERWRWVKGPIPHSKRDIESKYRTVARELWDLDEIHLWNVSFVKDNGFMADSVQGDGTYYHTTESDDLIGIFEEIATSMPVLVVR